MISYQIDQNNHINYEMIDNFVVVKFLFYYDADTLQQEIVQYYTYLSESHPNASFLTSYPGTTDPFVVKFHLEAMDQLGLSYRVHLDGSEVSDVNLFRVGQLNSFIQRSEAFMRRNQLQLACSNEVSEYCKSEGFSMCSVTTQLRTGDLEVDSLIRYYEIDGDNNLVSEHRIKPNTGNFYHSIRLRDKFANRIVKLVDGKPRYYPKDSI